MAIVHEVEAKLLAPRLAELDAIAARERLGAFLVVPRRRARLASTYVDTEGMALLAAGVCLRVRRDGARREATAKWMGEVEGDVHARPELTVALPKGRERELADFELPAGPLHDQLAAIVCGRALVPILVTRVDRRILDVMRRVGRGRAVVVAELALDRVHAEGPGRRARTARAARGSGGAEYGELELELRDGTVEELTQLAARLRREHGLSPTQETKLSRGLDAVYGTGLRERLNEPAPPLREDDSVGTGLRRALGEQLARIRAHDPGTRAGEDPEALHQQRVGVRRARAILRAFGDVLPPRRRAFLQRELRWLGRTLGAVRDLDVQLASAEQLAQALPERERGALGARVAELQAERVRQRRRLLAALSSARYFQLLLELETLARERDARPADVEQVPLLAAYGRARASRALSTLRERARAAAAHAGRTPADELHELRIRARRTRYLLELLSGLTGAPGRRLNAHLVRLQDALGEHQDAVVARAAIAELGARLETAGSGASGRGLARLAGHEEKRAARARAGFARSWKRFEREWRDVTRVLARLDDVVKRARRGGVS